MWSRGRKAKPESKRMMSAGKRNVIRRGHVKETCAERSMRSRTPTEIGRRKNLLFDSHLLASHGTVLRSPENFRGQYLPKLRPEQRPDDCQSSSVRQLRLSDDVGNDPAPNAYGVSPAYDSNPRSSSDESYACPGSKRLGFSGDKTTAKQDSLSILQCSQNKACIARPVGRKRECLLSADVGTDCCSGRRQVLNQECRRS